MTILEHYDDIARCNRCGFCQVACPIFRATGHEAGVARGRLALLRAIIEDRMEWSQDMEDPLFTCLLCGACTSNCFPAIPTADLLIKARAEYLQRVGRKPIHRLLFDHLLPYPRRLHLAARAVAMGTHSGLSHVARALGLLRIFGRDLRQAVDIIKPFPLTPLRGEWRPGVYEGMGRSLRIGYFVGCGVDILQQQAGRATLALLRKMGRDIHILNNCCCGLPAWSYGDLEAARRLAEKNLDVLQAGSFDVIVTDCSSCAAFLRKYPAIFTETDSRYEPCKVVVSRVQDVVQWAEGQVWTAIPSTHPITATYHDPCHACRGQGLTREPRRLLQRLPGLTFRELPEADWCCGGAGAYAFFHYDLSRKVLDRKMENLKKTGAEVVVTSCPACMMQLSYGIRSHGLGMGVRHLSEMIP